MTCPSCRTAVPDGARFCPTCGTPLFARGDERRVATVVFADVVGFTGLAEAMDPEQVKRLIDGCMAALAEEVRSFGGRVDKVMGDAMVALFGAPVAHEDDAERAVRAALRMQATVAEVAPRLPVPVRLRIGVNTGEVLVGALRAGGEYTALGDVVNTAQRLQAAAEPGQVLVGPATQAATAAAIRYEPLGELRAKGREGQVAAWLALAPVAPPGRRPSRVRAPLKGRDAELALVGSAIALGVQHGRAQLVVLEGEAGVGKSRLAEEAALLAEHRHGARVLDGHCVPYGEPNAWWPLAAALRDWLGLDPGAPVGVVRAALEREVAEAFAGRVIAAERERITAGLLALLGQAGGHEAVDPTRAREEITRSVVAFLEALCRRSPVVLVISDLHWADELVLELLGRVIVHLGALPFVLIATIRGSLEAVWQPPAGRHNTIAVHLDPLDRAAAAELLAELFVGAVPPELAEQLLDRSGGNPLFLEELAVVAGRRGDLAHLPALPDTLRGLIAARLDALPAAEREMLDNAAVLGPSGTLFQLLRFAEALGQQASAATLARLGEGGLLEVDGERWAFRSESVREVAYGTLTKEARAQRHCGVAGNMELGHGVEDRADRIAHHYATAAELAIELGGTVAGVPADVATRALSWLHRAAAQARHQDTPSPAVRHATRALTLVDRGQGAPADRRRFLLLRSWGLSGLRQLAEARADAEAALESARADGDRASEAGALTLIGEIEQRNGQLNQARVTLERAIALWREVGDPEGTASALRAAGLLGLFDADHQSAEAHLQEARALSVAHGDRRGEAWATQHLAWLSFVSGDTALADRRLHEAATTFTEIGDRGGLGWALGLLAFVRFQQGRLDEAASIAEQVRLEADARGDRWGLGMMTVLLANLRLWSGAPAEAVDLAAEARELFRQMGDRYGEAQALAPLARGLLASGRVAEANRALEACRSAAAKLGFEPMADVIGLGLAVHAGDPARARIDAVDAERFDALGAYEWAVGTGLAALQRADLDLAATRLAVAESLQPDHPYGLVARALLAACAGEPARARDLAARALGTPGATHLDRLTARLSVALSLAQEGRTAELRPAFDDIRLLVDATGDRVAQAIARLAEAEALAAVGSAAAPIVRREADLRLAALDLAATGWATAFRLAATAGRTEEVTS